MHTDTHTHYVYKREWFCVKLKKKMTFRGASLRVRKKECSRALQVFYLAKQSHNCVKESRLCKEKRVGQKKAKRQIGENTSYSSFSPSLSVSLSYE